MNNEKSLVQFLIGIVIFCNSFDVFSAGADGEVLSFNNMKNICEKVSKAIQEDRGIDSKKKLFVSSVELGGRSWSYQEIDLDKDGDFDEVTQSCGSGSDGSCMLKVTLFKGGV